MKVRKEEEVALKNKLYRNISQLKISPVQLMTPASLR
jgi:hypothetical protein